MTERRASVERTTGETAVRVHLDLSGGPVEVGTGVPFFDHMLEQIGRHARWSLRVDATGDLEVDSHHTVEDVGIALGQAIDEAAGEKRGIVRYGDALVPMEEALAQVAADISGRPLLVYDVELPVESIGSYDTALTEEFLQALCRAAGITMHVTLVAGRNAHHATEAVFKAVARALSTALAIDPNAPDEIPSTKGVL